MKKHLLAIFVSLILTSLACTFGEANSNPQSDIETAVAETQAAASLINTAVAETQFAVSQTPAALDSETPLASDTAFPSSTPTQQANAPNPLPASNTGLMLMNGECFDYDSGLVQNGQAANCDIWLVQSALLRQINTANTSGYASMTAPSLADCQSAIYDPNDLAVQTDLYMCFTSNGGSLGFIVARSYLGGIPATGISFDYWLFP